jgi:hypothetical protein
MRPITRETIVDRRQPLLRWSAVFAGAAISVALWVVLQMLGMGIGFAAIDVDNAGSLRDVGIGTTAWTAAAPMIAMFIGGIIAGRMAGTHERGVGATHGFVVWAITSLVGMCALVVLVTTLAAGAIRGNAVMLPQSPDDTSTDVAQATVATGQILLGAGISLVASLLTCVLGGAAGVQRRRRGLRRNPADVRTIETPVVPPPPHTTETIVATPPAP